MQIGTSTFEQVCHDKRNFFEGPEWQRFNLTKWQPSSHSGVNSSNPTLSTTECLRKMCTELDKIQRGLDPAYHGPVHLREMLFELAEAIPHLQMALQIPQQMDLVL